MILALATDRFKLLLTHDADLGEDESLKALHNAFIVLIVLIVPIVLLSVFA
ncbi:MAG: hypothetical protein RL421_155 [Actinomycetota bacterium]